MKLLVTIVALSLLAAACGSDSAGDRHLRHRHGDRTTRRAAELGIATLPV